MDLAKIAFDVPPDRDYRAVRHARGLRLTRCQCRAGAHDRPSDEQHQAFSVTLVERGTFNYRTRGGSALLSPLPGSAP